MSEMFQPEAVPFPITLPPDVLSIMVKHAGAISAVDPASRAQRNTFVKGLTPSSQTLTCTMLSASTVLTPAAARDLRERLMPTDYRFGIARLPHSPTTPYALVGKMTPRRLTSAYRSLPINFNSDSVSR